MEEKLYPLLNVSMTFLNEDNIEQTFIGDSFHYAKDISYFERDYLGHVYVNGQGKLFKLVGTKKCDSFIRRILHFGKEELVFEDLGKTMTFSELNELVIKRINTLEQPDRDLWLEEMAKCHTIAEIIG